MDGIPQHSTETEADAGGLGEKCAVFGVFGKGLDVSRLSFFGLYALQHRGQESAGIATADGATLTVHKGMGLVSQVFSEELIQALKGHIAVGHNRYSTAGGSKVKHAQPMLATGAGEVQKVSYDDPRPSLNDSVSLCSAPDDKAIALVHNGNLPDTTLLTGYLDTHGVEHSEFSDSRMVVEAIAASMRSGKGLEDAVKEVYPLLVGAFSILIASESKLIAIRDHCGIRPLCLAKLNGGYIIASETCALHPVGAEYMRDVLPGEMLVIDDSGIRSEQLAEARPMLDIFEFVYFARPDSMLLGKSVYEVRKECGRLLARENSIQADVVIPVPETAVPAAIGFAQESGIPFEMALTKNRYIHRTFIQPEQHIRDQGVKAKLTPIIELIKGKRLVIIDDSIVRGTTSKKIIAMLFEAGATEVHFLSSSPPVKYPDFYGIDTPKQDNLLGAVKTVPEMREYLGATSLAYLSYEGMLAATGVPESQLCTSCFTGEYPIDIGARAQEVRKVA
ncbi:MAG: amidophosphoribosyltransferase [Minisyncoccota bacterium]